jgi:predicted metal-dependent phosphoesterase TrpH
MSATKFDFHCHSDFSDGALSPEALANYAYERDIDLLALTDHDCVDGISELKRTIKNNQWPISVVNGVEVSTLTDYGEVHIVGLGIGLDNQTLNSELKQQQQKRWQRAELICEQLVKKGITGIFEYLQENIKQVVTRSHIATALMELGYVKNRQQAFKRYIGKSNKIKVPKDWMTLDQVIELIHRAGGVSILAHPTRYPLTNRKLSLLIESFKAEGGDAIEIAYPSVDKGKADWLEIQRKHFDLLASSGSDFHYPGLSWTDLGRFPPLSETTPHVLQRLQ